MAQRHQDGSRCPPDALAIVLPHRHGDCLAIHLTGLLQRLPGIQDVLHRKCEDLPHLVGIGTRHKTGTQGRHHGGHPEMTGHGHVTRQETQGLEQFLCHADLLMGFAQRCLDMILTRLQAPPRETDLACVLAQVCGTQGEPYRWFSGLQTEGYQHGRFAQRHLLPGRPMQAIDSLQMRQLGRGGLRRLLRALQQPGHQVFAQAHECPGIPPLVKVAGSSNCSNCSTGRLVISRATSNTDRPSARARLAMAAPLS